MLTDYRDGVKEPERDQRMSHSSARTSTAFKYLFGKGKEDTLLYKPQYIPRLAPAEDVQKHHIRKHEIPY